MILWDPLSTNSDHDISYDFGNLGKLYFQKVAISDFVFEEGGAPNIFRVCVGELVLSNLMVPADVFKIPFVES